MPSPCHFENCIGDVARRAIRRQANKARNAPHPLALVRGVALPRARRSPRSPPRRRHARRRLRCRARSVAVEEMPAASARSTSCRTPASNIARARSTIRRSSSSCSTSRPNTSVGCRVSSVQRRSRSAAEPSRARARVRPVAGRSDERLRQPRGRARRAARARARRPRVVELLPALARAGLGRRRQRAGRRARRAGRGPVPPTTTGVLPAARISSIAACASCWYSPTDPSWSSGQIPTRRAGDWFVRIGSPR